MKCEICQVEVGVLHRLFVNTDSQRTLSFMRVCLICYHSIHQMRGGS